MKRVACTRSSCGFRGKFLPALEIRAGQGEPPFRVVFDLPVCGICAARLSVDDLVADWTRFAEMIEGAGNPRPSRVASTVARVPIDDPGTPFFRKYAGGSA